MLLVALATCVGTVALYLAMPKGFFPEEDISQVRAAITPAQRQARIQRFQLAQGVTPDGRAGPLTLMLLNRVNGVSEPRLRTGG